MRARPSEMTRKFALPKLRIARIRPAVRAGGCAAYIAKPISVAHFLDVVRTYLEPTADTVA